MNPFMKNDLFLLKLFLKHEKPWIHVSYQFRYYYNGGSIDVVCRPQDNWRTEQNRTEKKVSNT